MQYFCEQIDIIIILQKFPQMIRYILSLSLCICEENDCVKHCLKYFEFTIKQLNNYAKYGFAKFNSSTK